MAGSSFAQSVEMVKSFCSTAESHYSSIDHDIINEYSEIKRCNGEIGTLEKYISKKEAAFAARKSEYDRAESDASYYQSLASDLRSEAYDAESDGEYDSLISRADDADAKAQDAQERAQDILGEMSILQQEIREAQNEISTLKAEISQHKSNLSQIAAKCTEIGRRLNRNGLILQAKAAEVNNAARPAFEQGGRTKFGSQSISASAWCSKIAQDGHNQGVASVNLGKKFANLAQSASSKADDDADNRKNYTREERSL